MTQSPNDTTDRIAGLREALTKDFNNLYTAQLTSDWRIKILIRKTVIGLMDLANLEQFITDHTDSVIEPAREAAWTSGYEAGMAVSSGKLKGITWAEAKRQLESFKSTTKENTK